MSTPSVSKTHKTLRREVALSREVVKGSLVMMNRLCGKPACKCTRGHKHRSLYLSRSVKGKTSMTYIPRDQEGKIMEAHGRYKRIQDLLNRLSEAHLKRLLTGEG